MVNHPEPYFPRSFTCPICETNFSSRAIRGSAARVKVRETDYHMIYDGISPLHYSIIVCPICFYAASNNSFNEPLRTQIADQVAIALRTLRKDEPIFTEERDMPTVLRSFQLAVQSAQLRKASAGQLAGSLLGAGWIARELNDTKLEMVYLNEARKQYEISYVQDKLPIGSLDEISMAYLVGELYRRTGNYKDAIAWFGRALSVRKGSISPALDKMIRDQWSQARIDAANAPEGETFDESPGETAAATVEAPSKTNEVPPPAATPIKRNRAKVTMNAHLYQDQVEWLSKLVNLVYNQGQKMTRDDVLRAVIDVVRETVSADDLSDIQAKSETELFEALQTKLKKTND
ncbi:MAG: DUF2225 domain-containing protein [Methylocystaceae bacterium]